jgi:hypothetical protein
LSHLPDGALKPRCFTLFIDALFLFYLFLIPETTVKTIIGLSSLLLALLVVGLAVPISHTQAQPRATTRAQAQAIQATAQAGATQVVATANALRVNASATIAAQRENINAAAESLRNQATSVAATLQYVATVVNQEVAAAQATVTALTGILQAQLNTLPTELTELLSYLAEQASLSYDPAAGTLSVTALVTEQQANDLMDLVVLAAGYDPDAVSLNTKADGTIDVMLVDVSGELSGTIVMTYRLTVVNGAVMVELVSVTLNGQSVPLALLPEALVSAVQLGVNAAAVQPMLNTPPVGYTVQTLDITEDGMLLAVVVSVE